MGVWLRISLALIPPRLLTLLSAALLSLLLTPSFTVAMSFSLPLNIEGRELGLVPVSLSGSEVDAVSLSSLKSLLGHRVVEHVWQTLSEEHSDKNIDTMVPLSALAEQGIDVIFDPATLTLTAKISSEVFGLSDVNFSDDFEPFIPTKSGEFSWLNSINFSHTESWQSDSSDRFSSADWLAQMNIGGAAGLNITTANYLEVIDDDSNILRGEWTAFYDKPNAPFRLSMGDVETSSSVNGHLSGVSLGGLSIKSDYAELQPNRTIGPNNNNELILKESAEVEITINGQIIFSGRQEAGRFNLTNLPMTNGANDIIVNVTYLSGKTERFVFSQFYNSNLLNEDMLNYALTAGAPSVFGDQGIEYLDTWTITGFAEYGVSSWLTLGVNAAAAKYGNVLGATATFGTNFGNLSSRLSISDQDNGVSGSIVSFSFESAIFGSYENQSPNLRLSAEFAEDFTSTPWEEITASSYDRYLANYVMVINSQWDATLSGSYYKDNYQAEQSNFTFMLNWRKGDFTLGSGITYSDIEDYIEADVQYFVTLDWRWTHTKQGFNLGASYNSDNNNSRFDLNRTNYDKVGSVGYRALVEYENERERQNAQLSYTANRARLEVEVERNEMKTSDSDAYYSASIRGNTAIGLVDGKLGWGRAQQGPFLVTHLHPSLPEQQVQMGAGQQDEYKAAATSMIGGLLPLEVAYTNNTLDLNVPDAPMGYDWGESRTMISPGAATGHFILVGSDSSYTAKGILMSTNGQAVSYLQGELIGEGVHQSFFTNKTGRFYVQGVGPGKYTMTVSDNKYMPLPVVIEQANSHLIELGTLNMECIKENCDENL